ncbi:MAG: hypothetical protein GTN74_07175 [Proteobacteria bacterium]|nr:hypothetical protein [Pseudomonadota bacterium]NIS69439.1 hypothetical protein [Pseudomonadota bacterium]
MADGDKDFEKAVGEHLKRVYERYKSNVKIFDATHIGNIVLAVIFLFAVLLPYLFIQIDDHQTSQELEKASVEIHQKEARVEAYRKAIAGLQKVFQAVLDTPKPLQGLIQSLEEQATEAKAPSSKQNDRTPDPCGSPKDIDRWMECRIQAFIQGRFSQYRRVLREEVAAPLERLNLKELNDWKAHVNAGIERVRDDFQKEISENPRFWRTFDKESPIYQKMVEAANRFWADHQFEAVGQKMKEEAALLRTAIHGIQSKQEQIKKRNDQLNDRLKNFKTRFGKIGFEVSQAVLILPMILGVVFLVASSNLCDSIRLRKSFQKLSQRNDPAKTVITDREVALSAPLWIDPLDPSQKRNSRFVILMIPAGVFVVALVTIFYCWTIPNAFPKFTPSDYWMYTALLLVSAGLFIFGFLRVLAEVRSYADGSEAIERIPQVPSGGESPQGSSEMEPKRS